MGNRYKVCMENVSMYTMGNGVTMGVIAGKYVVREKWLSITIGKGKGMYVLGEPFKCVFIVWS